jgi:hypothetical protein
MGQSIGGGSSGDPNRTNGLRMLEVERALPGLGLRHRNASASGKTRQRFRRIRIDDTATCNYQRSLGRANPLDSLI